MNIILCPHETGLRQWPSSPGFQPSKSSYRVPQLSTIPYASIAISCRPARASHSERHRWGEGLTRSSPVAPARGETLHDSPDGPWNGIPFRCSPDLAALSGGPACKDGSRGSATPGNRHHVSKDDMTHVCIGASSSSFRVCRELDNLQYAFFNLLLDLVRPPSFISLGTFNFDRPVCMLQSPWRRHALSKTLHFSLARVSSTANGSSLPPAPVLTSTVSTLSFSLFYIASHSHIPRSRHRAAHRLLPRVHRARCPLRHRRRRARNARLAHAHRSRASPPAPPLVRPRPREQGRPGHADRLGERQGAGGRDG